MATGYLKQQLKRRLHFDFFVDNEEFISVGFDEQVKEVGEIEEVLLEI